MERDRGASVSTPATLARKLFSTPTLVFDGPLTRTSRSVRFGATSTALIVAFSERASSAAEARLRPPRDSRRSTAST
ncbi:hypothetical protein [Halarchaeum acidiphilum]|uniref:hypothetical protein n=1 Tax=Halarchaeum acidiphilum TaxID=489138 RepID=UPI001F356460|nr:hypothetical protein [Halarchaeum acidiphilum]